MTSSSVAATARNPIKTEGTVPLDKADTANNSNGKPAYTGKPSAARLAHEKKMADIDTRIEIARQRLEDLKSGGGIGKNASEADRATHAALVEEARRLRESLRPHLETRRQQQELLKKLREDLEKRTGQVKEAKEKLPFRSSAELDARVRELETQVETGTLKLIEEKQLLAEITKLKKARRAFENIDTNSNDLGTLKLRIERARAEMAQTDEILKGTRSQLDAIDVKFAALRGNRTEQTTQREERQKSIEKAKKDLDEAFAVRRKAIEDNKVARKAAQEAYERRLVKQAEWERRQKIEEQIEALEEKLLAFKHETSADRKISECNNIKAYFVAFLPESHDATATTGSGKKTEPTATSTCVAPAGVRKVTISKELEAALAAARQEEKKEQVFYAGGKKHGGGGATHPKDKSTGSGAAASSTSEQLGKLPFHILSALTDLGLSIPTCVADIPDLFGKLEQRKVAFASKSDEARAEVEKKRQVLVDQIEDLKKQLDSAGGKKITSASNETDEPDL